MDLGNWFLCDIEKANKWVFRICATALSSGGNSHSAGKMEKMMAIESLSRSLVLTRENFPRKKSINE